MNFLGTVSEYLSWLYHDRQWAAWELVGIALLLLVVSGWIIKRLRRKSVKRVYGSHFLDGASVIGVKLADPSLNHHHKSVDTRKAGPVHSVGTGDRREKTSWKARGWKKAVEQIKRKPTEKKLEAELADLTAAYQTPRQENGGGAQTAEAVGQTTSSPAVSDERVHQESTEAAREQASPEQKVAGPTQSGQAAESLEQTIAELTAVNEKLRQELAEIKQTKEPLEQELAGQTSANEQLCREVADIKRAEERLEQKVAELTAANEQLKQEVTSGAGGAGRDDLSDERHRVVEGISEKLCRKCGQWKAEDEYHKHGSSRDGLANHCKQCRTEAARRRREKRNAAND